MTDIKYEIVKTLGVLSGGNGGWNKELNLVSWNDREPRYDLREWSADHEKMSKGITLSKEELNAVRGQLGSVMGITFHQFYGLGQTLLGRGGRAVQ